jgi:hypothetical protein
MLSAMCRGVRSIGQELQTMSLRLPSMLHCSAPWNNCESSLTHLPDMSVLLQQHQDDDERTVSCVSPAIRRLHHRVEDHLSRRVGPLYRPT